MPYYIPRRLYLVISLAIAFIFVNMQRSCISLSIILVRHQYHWTETQEGLVLSAFGWGYMFSQFFGVWLAEKIGAKTTLGFAVGMPGVFVMLFPFTAAVPSLGAFCYCLVGLSQGPLWPAYWVIIRNWFAKREKSSVIALISVGGHVGICISYGLSPYIFEWLNWQSSFYIYGSVALFWAVSWALMGKTAPNEESDVSIFDIFPSTCGFNETEKELFDEIEATHHRSDTEELPTPWRKILTNRIVICLIITQFCQNWNWYTLAAWVPSYFKYGLSFDLKQSGLFSVLPYMLLAVISQFSGIAADFVMARGHLSRSNTRKFFQSISFIAMLAVFLAISFLNLSPMLAAVLFVLGIPAMGFSTAGLSSAYPDVSSLHSGVIHATANTIGTLPGALGIFLIGWILEVSHNNWAIVWGMSAVFSLIGLVSFAFGVSLDQPIDFFAAEGDEASIFMSAQHKGKTRAPDGSDSDEMTRSILRINADGDGDGDEELELRGPSDDDRASDWDASND